MLVLDTNHYSETVRKTAVGARLEQRVIASQDDAFLTVVTAEESLKGWLAAIQPHRQADGGVAAYREFLDDVKCLAEWDILPWSADSVAIFKTLKPLQTKIGVRDLRIASIALEYEATVLTRNLRDFSQVPGLRVENWLD